MDLKQDIEQMKGYLSSIRRHFHQYPEASLQEFETALKIEQELDSMGIPHRRVGETGVCGTIRGALAGGKTVILRADTDALSISDAKSVSYRSKHPGLAHVCGHDAHTASLLGAAAALQKNRGCFGGEIRLFFQQGEEFGQGARIFIQEGLLNQADRILGIHMASDVPVGRVVAMGGATNASSDRFRITIHGKSAHASTPQDGTDALYIACQTVVALQGIVSRQTSPLDPVLVGVGKLHSGTAYNIVANTAVLEGTTRSFAPETRKRVNEAVMNIALQTAAAYGGTAELHWEKNASMLINDKGVAKEVGGLVTRLFGADQLVTDYRKSLGADDFAEFLHHLPGLYALVGSGNPDMPNTVLPHHHEQFDIDEAALPVAARLYAEYALWFLGQT